MSLNLLMKLLSKISQKSILLSQKMDENNDKVSTLTNTIISLQATVEALKSQSKPPIVEIVQTPPPSGQEGQVNSTQDIIKEVSTPVVMGAVENDHKDLLSWKSIR